MKRIVSFLLAVIIILFSFSSTCIASSNIAYSSNEDVIYFGDGSYITIDVEQDFYMRATNTISGNKSINYYNADDELKWTAVLNATFSYNGSVSSCTSANISYTIHDSSWRITSATATKSSNKATGNIVSKYYVLGLPVKTIEESFTITCSANGTLS